MGGAICPYCDFEFIPDDYGSMSEHDFEDYDCPKCEKTMQILIEHTMYFQVKRKGD